MWQLIKENPLAFILSAAVHAVVVVLMVVGVDWREPPKKIVNKVDVVQARIVDDSLLQAEINKQKQLQQEKKEQEKKRLADIK
ncbi:MAG: hypothetical protein P8Y20_09250, partial [Gammaproteobacteria bacterium]